MSARSQDAVAATCAEGGELRAFGRRNVLHLNDTHPALTPAELMRVLLDDHGLGWDEAWQVTTGRSHTNHTLMPEALETWRWTSSPACCPATWRSFSRSTTASCRGCAACVPATRRWCRACR